MSDKLFVVESTREETAESTNRDDYLFLHFLTPKCKNRYNFKVQKDVVSIPEVCLLEVLLSAMYIMPLKSFTLKHISSGINKDRNQKD